MEKCKYLRIQKRYYVRDEKSCTVNVNNKLLWDMKGGTFGILKSLATTFLHVPSLVWKIKLRYREKQKIEHAKLLLYFWYNCATPGATAFTFMRPKLAVSGAICTRCFERSYILSTFPYLMQHQTICLKKRKRVTCDYSKLLRFNATVLDTGIYFRQFIDSNRSLYFRASFQESS